MVTFSNSTHKVVAVANDGTIQSSVRVKPSDLILKALIEAGAIKGYVGTSAPDPATFDWWLDDTASPATLKRHNGTAWVSSYYEFSGGSEVLIDEDDFASDTAARAPTQQSAKAYIAAQLAALVGGAPGSLDTLNELAAALGDDEAFATSVTATLAAKQPLDSDLTAIAALTTASFGRSALEWANALAGRDALSVPSRASTIKTVADRTALKAEDISEHTFFWLGEAGREGLFMWTTGDKSSEVSADAQEGITIAHGTIASTTGAFERFLTDGLRPEWFGAAGDNGGTIGAGTDDTTALLACLAQCLSLKREMRLSAFYRYNPSAVISLAGADWGLLIRGDKRNGCGFVLDATKALEIEGSNSFYHHLADFRVLGNVSGPVMRVGKNDYSDAFNDFNMDRIVINNNSTNSAMEGLRLNYVLASRIHATVNGGGTGSGGSGQGKAVVLRQCAFNNFVLHCGQALTGISIEGGTSFGNTFFGIDIEEVGEAVAISSANATRNIFVSGQYLGLVTFNATAGDNNSFLAGCNITDYGSGIGSNLTGLNFESRAGGLVTYRFGGTAAGIRLTNSTTSFDQSLSGGTAFFSNYGGGIAFTGASGDLTLTASVGYIICGSALRLKSYTVATLPTASAAGAGATAYATDETGGAIPVFSDGTNWRRVTDRAVAA